MTSFRRLAVGSTAATVLLVAIGGLVRATKSGLGCGTDWPKCSGELLPALENRALAIEYSHRVAASVVVILLAWLALLAVRARSRYPKLMWPSVAAFGVVLSQALLGLVVVKLELQAVSVTLHLGTAMALLGLLVYLTIVAFALDDRLPVRADAALSRSAWTAAGWVLAVLLVGSYVTGRGAGLAFPDWPLMDGSPVPDLTVETNAIHFLHRVLAVAGAVVVVHLGSKVVARRSELGFQAKLAHAAMGLYAVELALGALNVWTELNAAAVSLHLLVAAAIWGTLVALAVSSRPDLAATRADRAANARPILEPGR
ncbi:MAG: heme A synthase [Actinomycetota bacterium]